MMTKRRWIKILILGFAFWVVSYTVATTFSMPTVDGEYEGMVVDEAYGEPGDGPGVFDVESDGSFEGEDSGEEAGVSEPTVDAEEDSTEPDVGEGELAEECDDGGDCEEICFDDADEAFECEEDYAQISAFGLIQVWNIEQLNAAVVGANAGNVSEIVIMDDGFGGGDFHLNDGANVTIRGEHEHTTLTVLLQDGFIVNAGAEVIFENLILHCEGCTAGHARRAINILGGKVTTRDVEIRYFTGSGIRGNNAVNAELHLESGTWIHSNSTSERGGGIWMNDSRVYIHEGVVIENNRAAIHGGGGIFIGLNDTSNSGHLEMLGGKIQHNTANGTGGGIHIASGRGFNMTGGLIYDNTASLSGGGIHLFGPSTITTHITGNSRIIYNRTGETLNGGGIFSQRPLMIESTEENYPVVISENIAGLEGGGIRTNQRLDTNGYVIISENRASRGGGIWTNNTLDLAGQTSVEENHALGTAGGIAYGGGGIRSEGSVVLRDSARVYNNESNSHGAGIRMVGGILRLYDDSEISHNEAHDFGTTPRNGGGIFTNAAVYLNGHAKVQHNHVGGTGAGIQTTALLEMNEHAQIYNNIAGESGGGIHATAVITMNAETSISNNSTGTTGGGIQTNNTVRMNGRSSITDNVAIGHGGGIQLTGATSLLEMNHYATIENNETNTQGGGVHAAGVVTMNSESNITSNIAGTTGGGIHVTGSGNLIMNHESAITDNIAGTTGGGIQNGGITTVTNDAKVSGNRLGHYGVLEDEENPYFEVFSDAEAYVFIPSGATGGGINNTATLNLRENAQIFGNAAHTTGGGIHTTTAITIGNDVQIFENIAGTNGGGINATQPLILRNSVQIFGNRTIGTTNVYGEFVTGNGGGIHAAALTIYDEVEIFDNIATINGGGIHASGVITLNPTGDGITVNGNIAGSNGGGIFTSQPFTLGGNVQINDNDATLNGGGVSVSNAFTMIDDAIVEGNRAGQNGGGVHVTGVFTMQDDAIITNNHAGTICEENCPPNRPGNGGGVFVAGAANHTYLLDRAQIIDNHAHGATGDANLPGGGGVGGGALINGNLVARDDVRVAENTSGAMGGGLRVITSLTLENRVMIEENFAATPGGGISTTGPTVIQDDVQIIYNNTLTNGGGIHGTDTIIVRGNAMISGNRAGVACTENCNVNRPGSGGGISNTAGNGRIYLEDNAQITDNFAHGITVSSEGESGGVGGGILASNLIMNSGAIQGNFANMAGGGVRVPAGGNFEMNNASRIYDNHANETGGGVSIALTGVFNMNDHSLIEYNTALTGGGVSVANSQGLFTMNDESRLYNNHAIGVNPQGVGGGLSTNGRAYINDRARIHYNTANLQGGGAQSGPAGTLIIQTTPDGLTPLDSSIDGNHQAGTFFGGIYQNRASSGAGVVSFGRAELRSGLIVQNVAQNNGGGVNVAGVNGLFYMPGGVITGNLACGHNIDNGYGGGVSVSGTFTMGSPMPLSGVMPAIYRYDEELDMEEPGTPDASCVVQPLEAIDLSSINFTSLEPLIIRNTAGNGGGGISVNQSLDGSAALGGRGFMLGGRITENIALSTYGVAGGGGINLQGPRTYFTVTGNSQVDHNEAIRTAAGGNGGGIRSLNGNLTIAGNAQIEHNLAQGHGGGVSLGGQVPGTTGVMTGGHITENDAQRYGGGIHIGGNSNFTMDAISDITVPHITDNFALRGGGISLEGTHIFDELNQRFQATANIHHGIVADNDAQFEGGGIHVIGINRLNLHEGAQILQNSAPTGGGIRVAFQAVLTMTGGLISENEAQFSGGGISLPSSTVPLRGGPLNYARMYMTGGEISNNTADFGGGIGFTGVENWNMSHNSLNRLTITDTGTTVAYNTATHLVNGIELWGTHWRNPSNIGNQAIQPSVINESLLDYFEHAGPDWGAVGTPHAGYNRFALTNYDIQIRELTRTVRFTSVGPGFLRPGNIRHVVGLGAVLNEECDDSDEYCPEPRHVPETVVLEGDEGEYCEFLYWVSDSTHHLLEGRPTTTIDGQVFTILTEEDIRYDLPILEDTIFTAYFNCQTAHIIVDFDIIGGALHHPEAGELPNYEFRLASLPDRPLRDNQMVPIPVADHPDRGCVVTHWTSDDEFHDEIITDEGMLRSQIITQDTVFTAHVTCQIGLRVDFTVDYSTERENEIPYRQGQLYHDEYGVLEYEDFWQADLTVQPGNTVAEDATIPIPSRPGTNYVFTTWTSSCPSHWIDGDPNTRFTREEIRELMIRRDTTFTAFFEYIPPAGVPFRFRKFNDYLYLDLDANYPTHENLQPLQGATFTLQRCTQNCETGENHVWSEVIDTAVSDAEGWVEFSDETLLSPTGVYRLVETVAPTGFNLPHGYWILTWDVDAEQFNFQAQGTLSLVPAFRTVTTGEDGAQSHYYYLGNFPRITLPNTGGLGALTLMLVGGLTLVAGVLLYLRGNVEEELEEN